MKELYDYIRTNYRHFSIGSISEYEVIVYFSDKKEFENFDLSYFGNIKIGKVYISKL